MPMHPSHANLTALQPQQACPVTHQLCLHDSEWGYKGQQTHTIMVWFISLSFGQACLTQRYTDLDLSNGTEKERKICPSKLAPGNTFNAALQRAWQILKAQSNRTNEKIFCSMEKHQGLAAKYLMPGTPLPFCPFSTAFSSPWLQRAREHFPALIPITVNQTQCNWEQAVWIQKPNGEKNH